MFRNRHDYNLISQIVADRTRVLDLGCGEGDLLLDLKETRFVTAVGIELDEAKALKCIGKGINVIHGDMEKILEGFADDSFDYVILSQTLQEIKRPDVVLRSAVRVGRYVIASFPNFAHISLRWGLFFEGRAPKGNALPNEWYEGPNIHYLSIKDFFDFCWRSNIDVVKAEFFTGGKKVVFMPNLFAEMGLFLLRRKTH